MEYHGKISFIVLMVFFVFSCSSNIGRFELENKSANLIVHATVDVCGQKFSFQKIQANEIASENFKITADCDYDVKLEFESGELLQKKLGYITNGIDRKDKIVITDSQIEIYNQQ